MRNYPLVWAVVAAVIVIVIIQLFVFATYCLIKMKPNIAVRTEMIILTFGLSTMVADAIIHIIPDALHSEEEKYRSLYLGWSAISGMLLVVVMEYLIHLFGAWHLKKKATTENCESDFKRSKSNSSARSSSREEHEEHEHHDLCQLVHEGACNGNKKEYRISEMVQPSRKISSLVAELENENQCRNHEHTGTCNHDCHQHGFSQFFQNVSSETTPSAIDNSSQDKRKNRLYAAAISAFISQALHDLVDGIAVGVAFHGRRSSGIATSLAILAHEIPLQLANLILLKQGGFSDFIALLVNSSIALFILVGVIATFADNITLVTPYLQMTTAGNFICLGLCVLLQEVIMLLQDSGSSTANMIYCIISGIMGCGIVSLLAVAEESSLFGEHQH